MVYLALPIETTSLRGLAFLVWPKNGVAFTRVVELATDAISLRVLSWFFLSCVVRLCLELKLEVVMGKVLCVERESGEMSGEDCMCGNCGCWWWQVQHPTNHKPFKDFKYLHIISFLSEIYLLEQDTLFFPLHSHVKWLLFYNCGLKQRVRIGLGLISIQQKLQVKKNEKLENIIEQKTRSGERDLENCEKKLYMLIKYIAGSHIM